MTPTFVTSCTTLPPEGAVLPKGGLSAGQALSNTMLSERDLSKLRWRCRRGLLENDLFIERFFSKFEKSLTVNQAKGLNVLMDLSDNDLLDLHLARKSIDELVISSPSLDCAEAREVLLMLQNKA